MIIVNPDDELQVDLLLQLSSEYGIDDFQKSLDYAHNAIELSTRRNDIKGQILSNIHIAKIYQKKGGIKEAFDYVIEARNLAKEKNYTNEYAQAIYLMANIYVEIGEYEKTAELCFEALKIFEELQEKQGICDVLGMIGGNYYMQGELDEAEKYLQQSIDLSKSINYKKGLGKGLTNISAVYNMRDETEKAIEYLYVGCRLFQETGEKVREGVAYCNIALYYLKLNEVDSAFKYTNLSMQLNELEPSNRNMVLTHIVRARSFLQIEDTAMFLSNMKHALEIADENGLKSLSYNAASNLLDFYSSIEDYDMAFHYGRLQYALKDSLDRNRSLSRLSQLQMLYQIEKEEQERKLNEQRKEFISGIIILTLIIGLILLVFIVFRYRVNAHLSKLKNEKLENELYAQQKDLAANVMSLMKKNEMLSEINEKLIKIRKELKSEDAKKKIANIAFEIENNTQDKSWEEFEIRFKQVHTDFYTKLMDLYPGLTSNEIRLCAFLKLNLTTKEISSITGQSPRSLEVARYRLRKKLNISSSSTNLTTLINNI
ncbi:tetratricopeptide repeat protein [Lentimicrobium sp. S6]|nr:tetratricopeptide repeat protein [Lentimicrobium sp. S6]